MNDILEREALILAGGLGTRLRPIVGDRPKPIAEVRGRPFIKRLLDLLQRFGYRRVILCVGYRGEQVRAEIGDHHGSLSVLYSFEEAPLGTAGALRKAASLLRAPHVLAMNGDSYCEIDLAGFAATHLRLGGETTMAVVHREDCSNSGTVALDADGRILAFLGRPATAQPGLINAGLYMFRREALEAIPTGRPVSLEDEIFPRQVERKVLFGWRVDSNFIDIGTPESYRAAQKFFAD